MLSKKFLARNNIYIKLLFIMIFCLSCINEVEIKEKTSIVTTESNRIGYGEFKTQIALDKVKFQNKTYKEISDHLFTQLDDKMYFYWLDTPWDYSGISEVPKEGTIACGYFVTTLLRDLGFEIQRVKLAQNPSSVMINQLCQNIKRFYNFQNFTNYLKNQPNKSIYILGLDYHTGFILKDSHGIYFFHSDYNNKKGVTKEKIEDSKALKDSKTFMIGNLTSNEKLLKKWLIK